MKRESRSTKDQIKGRRRFIGLILAFLMVLSILPMPLLSSASPAYAGPVSGEPAGGQVVLYLPSQKAAVTTELMDGKYGKPDFTVEVTGDQAVDPPAKCIFVMEKDEDGFYSFKGEEGQYLASLPQGSGLSFEDQLSDLCKWEFEDAGEGLVYIKNKTANYGGFKPQYLEYYSAFSDFTTYGNKHTDAFQFQILPLAEAEPPSPALPVEGECVLFLPKEGLAMTNFPVGDNLMANPATYDAESNQLTEVDPMSVFMVEATDEGIVFTNEGKYLTSAPTGKGLSLEDQPNAYSYWELESTGLENGSYYIKNKSANFQGKAQYLEYYNTSFSTFGKSEAYIEDFQFLILPAPEDGTTTDPGLNEPEEGPVVLHVPAENQSVTDLAMGQYGMPDDTVQVEDGKAVNPPGRCVFDMKRDDEGYLTFKGEQEKYLTAPSTGGGLQFVEEATDYSKWKLEDAGEGLFFLQNKAAKDNDAPQYLEYFSKFNDFTVHGKQSAGGFKFHILSVSGEIVPTPSTPDGSSVTGDHVEAEPVSGANVEKDQTITLKAADGASIYYTMTTDGTEPEDPNTENQDQLYKEPIPVPETPSKDKELKIKAVALLPDKDGKKKAGPVCAFTYQGPSHIKDYAGLYFGQLHGHTNLSDGQGTVEEAFRYAREEASEHMDFMAITDHSNSFEGRAGLPNTGTTHLGDENAETVNESWRRLCQAARQATADSDGAFIGLHGFEMTWSGGSPGHLNTFNSKGFENRNAAPFNTGTSRQRLKAYYDVLAKNPETISQWNHPGNTFGDFLDFDLYSPEYDKVIQLMEVGNGEGTVHGSGYFPSYDYYHRALDKGWHVAPSNGQDTHKGRWGNCNTARTVVLADRLTEEGIWNAIRNYRVYATEDNDFEIYYSLNGNAMGSIIPEQTDISIHVKLKDPTDDLTGATLNVVADGGQVVYSEKLTRDDPELDITGINPKHSYYYLDITQTDKDRAATAAVWTGEKIKAGINQTRTNIELPIKGDTITISSNLYNNMASDAKVKSLTYTIEGEDKPFYKADASTVVDGKSDTLGAHQKTSFSFPYQVNKLSHYNIKAEVVMEINGQEYTFSDVLKMNVTDSSIASKVLIDGSHYNDYVTGYYSNNATNLVKLCARRGIQARIVQPGEELTAEDLKDVQLFVVTAPLKRTSQYTGGAVPSVFEEDFINLVKDYVNGGGTVVVTGIADYQDGPSPYTSYEQANKMLAGIGAGLRIHDDEVVDWDDNGGSGLLWKVFPKQFNDGADNDFARQLLTGVKDSGLSYQVYSGCSVDTSQAGTWLVKGEPTTLSINSKAPSLGHDKPVVNPQNGKPDDQDMVVTPGEVVMLASEDVGQGHVIVGGTAFVSNFDISDNGEAQVANELIVNNLLGQVEKEITLNTIQKAREAAKEGKEGQVFTVEGTVTNGRAFDRNSFFDCIYIQDDEGNGINVFPVNDDSIATGDHVRVSGSIGQYQGDHELLVLKIDKLAEKTDPEDIKKNVKTFETKDAANYDENFGRLVRVVGKVSDVKKSSEGEIVSFVLTDDSGQGVRIFIDGYIGYSDPNPSHDKRLESFVKEGATVEAMGFVSKDPEGNRLRVRDRSEILEKLSDSEDPGTKPGEDPGTKPGEDPGTKPGENPGTKPGENPGTKPGEKPGTTPGQEPGGQTDDQKHQIRISFDPGQGAFPGKAKGEKIFKYGKPGDVITIPSGPNRPGYKFLYWKGSKYYPGDQYTITEENHNFVAIWDETDDQHNHTGIDDNKGDSSYTDPSHPDHKGNTTGSSANIDVASKNKNASHNSPNTGDPSLPGMVMVLLGLASTGLVFIGKKRKDH